MSDDPEQTVPLEEWCRDKSSTDRRVELLAVFAYRERQAGTDHDVPANYASRYATTEATPTR